MKNRKKANSIFLCIILAFSILPFPALADSYETGWTTTNFVELNYSGQMPRTLSISGHQLLVDDIPAVDDYAYLMLCLYDTVGTEIYRNSCARNKENRQTTLLLPDTSFGRYKLILYHSSDSSRYYYVCELPMERMILGWVFLLSPFYSQNLEAASTERTDEAALAYYLRPSEDIQSEAPEIITTSKIITSAQSSHYGKAAAIHDWVCDNIYYNYDSLHHLAPYGDTSALGTLRAGMSVCEGYTNLTVALLRAAGIPAKKVVGYAGKDFGVGELTATVSSENITKNHAWTEACIDGRWILMDTTWDSGNRFENGTITASDGCESHKYFDISQALISYNHVVIDANNYAELSLYIGYPQMWNGSGWRDCSSDALTPYVYQGATYAPLANLIWEMGGSVVWDTTTDPGWNKIICEVNGHNVQMWLNYGKFYVDGRECFFAVPPSLSGESIIVEIGILFRAMGYDVTWDGVRDQWQPGRVTIAYAT